METNRDIYLSICLTLVDSIKEYTKGRGWMSLNNVSTHSFYHLILANRYFKSLKKKKSQHFASLSLEKYFH